MECYNLFFLSYLEDDLLFGRTERIWANRSKGLSIKSHERRCVEGLVRDLFPLCSSHDYFDGFIFSYTIPHIGKEFDLLKITEHGVLNIELKSSNVGRSNIEEQLQKNKYYLSHLSRPVYACTYVLKTGKYYSLNEQDELIGISKHEVALALSLHATDYVKHIAPLFKACQYLISPVADPERFITGNYFLTLHQQQAKNKFLSLLEERPLAFAVKGSVGTGKTLLLYDLCKTLAKQGKRCLFLYPGELKKGHLALNGAINGLHIRSAAGLTAEDLEGYDCCFADEASALDSRVLQMLAECHRSAQIPLVVAYDPEGKTALGGRYCDPGAVLADCPVISGIHLTNTIRTNADILYFAGLIFDKDCYERPVDLNHVTVIYLPEKEAEGCIDYYQKENYGIYDCRVRNADLFTAPAFPEYDKGVILIDGGYRYNAKGRLLAAAKGEARTVLQNRLKKAILKVREKIVLIVTDRELYSALLPLYEPNPPKRKNKWKTTK